jgi:hypothetical protein
MANKGAAITIKGMDGLLKRLKQIPENLKVEVDAHMGAIAADYRDRAENDAPQDERRMANQITVKKVKAMDYRVVSPAPYSAYMEFGTKSRFKAIPGIDSSKFKGKGTGDYEQFKKNIIEWVRRKGITSRFSVKTRKRLSSKADKAREESVAYAIIKSIIKNGVHAHPFFFKQLPIARAEFTSKIDQVIQKAMKK